MTDYPMIRLQAVTKRFGTYTAVDDVSLDIVSGEFFALLGASGSGKTTLLRLIGGFEVPTIGSIEIDGQEVTDLKPYRRPTNTVFQSYALFPHLTLAENVAYGLLNQKLSRPRVKSMVDEALDRVRLPDLGARYPNQISGGQRQRIALARALICRPKVLLLDEPLGALDKRLREEMHVELRQIQRDAGITFLLVTHDQEEAMSLADRIAIMARGKILQVGTPLQMYEAPTTEEVARFISSVNILKGTCTFRERRQIHVEVGRAGLVRVNCEGHVPSIGDTVKLAIRPEKIQLVERPRQGMNVMRGVLRDYTYAGDRNLAMIDVPGLSEPMLVTISNSKRIISGECRKGRKVSTSWSPSAASLLTK